MSFLFGSNSQQEEKKVSGGEMVERLVTRLESSVIAEDRRASVQALRSMSKQYKVEVGTHGMQPIISVLKDDRHDTEICNFALETLITITQAETPEGEEPPDHDVGVMFTEIFVKNSANVLLLLSLLEEKDLYVRLNTVKLLTILLLNRAALLQEAIMQEPVACSRLMGLLQERREIIRNEALLLLTGLTKGNQQIQKIVAFQNAFEEILAIIEMEGYSEGGIIVSDCIALMKNLVTDNVSNQNFFRESFIFGKLVPFFNIEKRVDWEDSVVTNIVNMLQFMRLFTLKTLPKSSRTANQAAIVQTNLFVAICNFAFTSTFPARHELLHTIGNVMRANIEIQGMFYDYKVAGSLQSLIALLNIAFQSSNPVTERYATVYCFQCITEGNADIKTAIAHTLRPEGIPADGQSVGLLLCQGILAEGITWEGSAALAHVLLQNSDVKEKLLEVALLAQNGEAQQLLAMVVERLSKIKDRRGRVGLLLLLACWLHGSPFAVSIFLQTKDVISFLMNLIHDNDVRKDVVVDGLSLCLFGACIISNDGTKEGADQDALLDIIKHSGTEDVLGRLERFAKCDELSQALQDSYDSNSLFTTSIAASLEEIVSSVKDVISGERSGGRPTPSHSRGDAARSGNVAGIEYHDQIVAGFKEMIREQDARIAQLTKQLDQSQSASTTSSPSTPNGDPGLAQRLASLETQLADAEQRAADAEHKLVQQAQDGADAGHEVLIQRLRELEETNSALEKKSSDQHAELVQLHAAMTGLTAEVEPLANNLKETQAKLIAKEREFSELKAQHDDLLIILVDENEAKSKYRQRLMDHDIEVTDDEEEDDEDEDDDEDDDEEEGHGDGDEE